MPTSAVTDSPTPAPIGVATPAPADITPAPTEDQSATVAPAPQTEAPTTSSTAFLTAMPTSAVTDSPTPAPTSMAPNTEEVAGDGVEPVVDKLVQDSGNNTVTPTEEQRSHDEGVEMSLRTSQAEVASDQAADVHAPSTNAEEEAARLAAAIKIQSLARGKQGRRKAVVQMGKPSGYYFAIGDPVSAQIMREEEKRLEKLEEEKRLEKLEKEREKKNKQREKELKRVEKEIQKERNKLRNKLAEIEGMRRNKEQLYINEKNKLIKSNAELGSINQITKKTNEMNNIHAIKKLKACVRTGPTASIVTECANVVNQICSNPNANPNANPLCRTWLSMQK